MNTLRFLFVVTGCLALTWPAVAADGPLGSGPLTLHQARMMDANKDGVISNQEYAKQSPDMMAWSEMDANGDGILDADEQRRNVRHAPIYVR